MTILLFLNELRRIHDGTERNMDTLYNYRRGVGMPYHLLCVRCQNTQRGKNSTKINLESRIFLDCFSYGNILKFELAYAIIEI